VSISKKEAGVGQSEHVVQMWSYLKVRGDCWCFRKSIRSTYANQNNKL